MKRKIGFLINPIAGIGGRVGLKGSDNVVDQAIALGASALSADRARAMLESLQSLPTTNNHQIEWLTCGGKMGEVILRSCKFNDINVVYSPKGDSNSLDTQNAVRAMQDASAELIVFCGGDGTARDIASVVKQQIPILGTPCGVKMYSGVFGTTPPRTAEILAGFLDGNLAIADAEIMDLDEEQYRQGNWVVRLCDVAKVPAEPVYTQAAKSLVDSVDESIIKQEIATEFVERVRDAGDTLFLLGPGSTMMALGIELGIDKTLLGIDAVYRGKLIGTDLNESALANLLDEYPKCRLVVSPIGAQGFVLGRGNLQLSPEIVRRIGIDNINVIATPEKLAKTPALRFDTGDSTLDQEFANKSFLTVTVGADLERLVRVVV